MGKNTKSFSSQLEELRLFVKKEGLLTVVEKEKGLILAELVFQRLLDDSVMRCRLCSGSRKQFKVLKGFELCRFHIRKLFL